MHRNETMPFIQQALWVSGMSDGCDRIVNRRFQSYWVPQCHWHRVLPAMEQAKAVSLQQMFPWYHCSQQVENNTEINRMWAICFMTSRY
jgi:hypothetical protein